jgi:phosphoribosylformimino-5-aminoimidazole carboxamide ribotide isomerase
MLAIPSISIGAGPAGDDPVQVARQWTAMGFNRLHVVDVDAASDRGDNAGVIRELLRNTSVPVQVAGGVRDTERLDALLDDGADQVVIGTRGVEDTAWLEEQAARVPGRIVLALDLRARRVMTRAWTRDSRRDVFDLLAQCDAFPLAGIMVTPSQHDARLSDAEFALAEEIAALAPWPVLVTGGGDSLQDLRNLETRGIAAVVLGAMLTTETMDPRIVAEEFVG